MKLFENLSCYYKLVIFFIILKPFSLLAQENGIGFSNNIYNSFNKIYDSYGNKYDLKDIRVTTSNVGNNRAINNQLLCSSGIFELYFETGSGMENTLNPIHNQRRDVLCKVFTDISNFIQTNLNYSSTTKVKIWVRDIKNTPDYKNKIISYGSAFYHFPFPNSLNGNGIIDNEVWKTIHTGVDSYTNTLTPLQANYNSNTINSTHFYHGLIAFNFSSSNKWNLNLTNAIPSNKMDLYSAILKEVGHILGIVSLIDKNGDSVFGTQNKYYSRFDTYLKNSSNQSLILNPSTGSPMYNYNYTLSNTFLNSNCTTPYTSNNTVCSTAISYSGSVNIPVYTPNCFENRKSLSHLEDQCVSPYGNDNYFVMSNNILNGITKRYFKPEERAILCDIGYTLNSTYGTTNINYYNYGSSCNGNKVAGVNDGLNNTNFTFIGNAETPIIISGILNNDVNFSSGLSNSNIANLRFEGLQDVYQNSSTTTIVPSGNDSNSTITFTSSVSGIHLLRYVPYDVVTGLRGNITYIYVFVNPINFINNTCGTPTNCNLIINGDFEQYNNLPSFFSQISFACNWQNGALSGSPDYFHSNGSGNVQVPSNFAGNQLPNYNLGNAYAGFWCSENVFQMGSYREHIATQLAEPLRPNTSYSLKFDVSQSDSLDDNPAKLQACFTNLIPGGVYGGSYTNYEFPLSANDILLTNTSYSTNTTGWDTITFSFTTGNNAGQKYLYLGGLNNVDFLIQTNNLTNNLSYYYIDNVSLVPEYGNTINLPANICLDKTLTNLAQYIVTAPTGGVFTGAGVTETGGVYSFNATSAGVGTHIITYEFNDNVGCPPVIVNTTIEVIECGIPYISQVFVGTNNDKAVEVKNASNTQSITAGQYYLVWYQGNGAPANLTTPTASIDLVTGSNIAANGVKVFKAPGLANPPYIIATATPFNTLQGFDGIYDVMIISTSNGANAYNDRVDIIGDTTINNIFYKDYTQEEYKSLVRVSCMPLNRQAPQIAYDEQDWVGFNKTYDFADDTEVFTETAKTNDVLGRHYNDVVEWIGSWDDLGILDPANESTPDRSRSVAINALYDTSISGNFEACSLISNIALNIAELNNVKVQTKVTSTPPMNGIMVQNQGSLIQVRDTFYGLQNQQLIQANGQNSMKHSRETVGLNRGTDYVYWSSPLSLNAINKKAGQIFGFGSAIGQFNPSRFYRFENQNFYDMVNTYGNNGSGTDGYDDNLNDYVPFSSIPAAINEHFIPGRGYATWPPISSSGLFTNYAANYTITFEGEMNNGKVEVPVYRNDSQYGTDSNLIGNPYPSPIDLDKFLYDPVNSTLIRPVAFIWGRFVDDTPLTTNPGPELLDYIEDNFKIYNPDMDIDPTQAPYSGNEFIFNSTLASCQSFFVMAKDPNNGSNPVYNTGLIETLGNIRFSNYMRTTELNNTFSRTGSFNQTTSRNSALSSDKLWVNITDANGYIVQLGVVFKPEGDATYNQNEDVETVHGRKYNFYTQTTLRDLIIDVQDEFNTSKEIPLGILNNNSVPNQTLTISIPRKSGIFNSQSVYLYDAETATTHNITNGVYSFTTNQVITEGRFKLVFEPNTSTSVSKQSADVICSFNQNGLTLTSFTTEIESFEVYDLEAPKSTGYLIASEKNGTSKSVSLPLDSKHRLISVKIKLKDGTQVAKKLAR